MTVELPHLSAAGTAIGGRWHVRQSIQEGRQVVHKGRRPAHGVGGRGLFLEASLQSAAAERFAGWQQRPVDPPLWCTDTALTTAFYDGMVTPGNFFGERQLLTAVAERVGTAIAWLHTAERQRVEELPPAAIEVPPLAPIPLATVAEQSGATLELAAVLHRGAFAELLEGAERTDQPDVFVHGDLKFDNVLTDRAGTGMKIIDWECAGRGDAILDLAAFSASLICEGVRLGAVAAERSVREGLERTDTETTKAWAAISTFVASYREGIDLARVPVNPLIRLCARFLLARVTSYTDTVGAFDRLPKSLVRVAHNMVKRPELFERRFW